LAALAASGALPENVIYAGNSSLLLSPLESMLAIAAKLRDPDKRERWFEAAVEPADHAAVLVLVG
jgi:hypothetical protein